jgi:hypothetical protein
MLAKARGAGQLFLSLRAGSGHPRMNRLTALPCARQQSGVFERTTAGGIE